MFSKPSTIFHKTRINFSVLSFISFWLPGNKCKKKPRRNSKEWKRKWRNNCDKLRRRRHGFFELVFPELVYIHKCNEPDTLFVQRAAHFALVHQGCVEILGKVTFLTFFVAKKRSGKVSICFFQMFNCFVFVVKKTKHKAYQNFAFLQFPQALGPWVRFFELTKNWKWIQKIKTNQKYLRLELCSENMLLLWYCVKRLFFSKKVW